MKVTIKTYIQQKRDVVFSKFNASLFEVLAPPFPPVKLCHFGGCRSGDEVVLELNFIIFKQKWISKITKDGTKETQTWFIDEGIKLPFFLKKWTHRHVIQDTPSGCVIVDLIEYDSYPILKWILWPILYLQFAYRRPIYKQFFS